MAAMLRRLVELNGLAESIEIVPIALSDTAGELWLSAPDPINPGTFRVAGAGQGQRAEALRLDDALRRLGVDPSAVSLVKIDVEGHEEQVLRGGERLLADGDPVLAVETFDTGTFDRISAWLGAFGYAPAAVHCATPTVLFRRGAAPEAAVAIRARVLDYENTARRKR